MNDAVCVWQGRLTESDQMSWRLILRDPAGPGGEDLVVEAQQRREDAMGAVTFFWSSADKSYHQAVVRRALRDMHDEIERLRVRAALPAAGVVGDLSGL